MESELFDWKGWDPQDVFAFTFYDVVLKVKIGEFEPGTKFDMADVDYDKGTLQFSRLGPENKKGYRPVAAFWDFKLKLQVI